MKKITVYYKNTEFFFETIIDSSEIEWLKEALGSGQDEFSTFALWNGKETKFPLKDVEFIVMGDVEVYEVKQEGN